MTLQQSGTVGTEVTVFEAVPLLSVWPTDVSLSTTLNLYQLQGGHCAADHLCWPCCGREHVRKYFFTSNRCLCKSCFYPGDGILSAETHRTIQHHQGIFICCMSAVDILSNCSRIRKAVLALCRPVLLWCHPQCLGVHLWQCVYSCLLLFLLDRCSWAGQSD